MYQDLEKHLPLRLNLLIYSPINGSTPYLPDGKNFTHLAEYGHLHKKPSHCLPSSVSSCMDNKISSQNTDSTTSPTFRAIIAQLAEELGIQIINDILFSEHIHLFVSIPPHIAVSEFVRRTKGRSSGNIQQELAKKEIGIGTIILGVAAVLALLVVMQRTKSLMAIGIITLNHIQLERKKICL